MSCEEKLKIEYDLLEVDSFITTRDEALNMMEMFIDDEEQMKFSILRDAKICNRNIFITKFLDLFFNNSDGVIYFKQQLHYITEQFDLILQGIDYQNRLMEIVDEDNYLEVYKLSKFLDHNLILNYNYFNSIIDSLYYASKGIGYSVGSSAGILNNKEELFLFIEENLFKYRNKEMELIKKI